MGSGEWTECQFKRRGCHQRRNPPNASARCLVSPVEQHGWLRDKLNATWRSRQAVRRERGYCRLLCVEQMVCISLGRSMHSDLKEPLSLVCLPEALPTPRAFARVFKGFKRNWILLVSNIMCQLTLRVFWCPQVLMELEPKTPHSVSANATQSKSWW